MLYYVYQTSGIEKYKCLHKRVPNTATKYYCDYESGKRF